MVIGGTAGDWVSITGIHVVTFELVIKEFLKVIMEKFKHM